jgi:hypothetical protein
MSQQIINNGDTGLDTRNKLNAMFGELYSSLAVPVKVDNVNANTTINIAANTFLDYIASGLVSGTCQFRIGTTPNGEQIVETTDVTSFVQNSIQRYFAANTTLYITIVSGTLNFRFGVIENFF